MRLLMCNKLKILFAFIIGTLLNPNVLLAADSNDNLSVKLSTMLILFGFAVVLVLFLAVIIEFFRNVRREYIAKGKDVPQLIDLFGIFDGDIKGWSGHNNDEVMAGHEYDGIREFDNDLPPWWKYMFYISITFGVIYAIHYHFLGTGDLQTEEYIKQAEYHKKMYPEIDPVWSTVVTDEARLKEAKETFIGNCAACHGENAQGMTGPNLTDQYWLYKGGVNDVFQSIKHGRSRGMKAWKADFGNDKIHAIASYVLSLQGSSPEGALDPEGELYTGEVPEENSNKTE